MGFPAWCGQTLRGLYDLFLPPACPLCTALIPPDHTVGFCPTCLSHIPPMPAASCRRCAHPYPLPAADDHLCGICLPERDPPFDRVIPGGLYADALQDAIHRFKYRSQIDLDRPLARLLLPQLTDIARDCDLILPVPLHPRKLRQRTYNQSLLIARILAPALGLPLATSVLIRHRDTLPQQGQDAASRRKNLHNAFRATRPLAGTRILLIDDVLTTGATARECSRSLKKAGGGDIVVAVLARAPAAFRN